MTMYDMYPNTWSQGKKKTTKTTTREYDDKGNMVKETVVEETTEPEHREWWERFDRPRQWWEQPVVSFADQMLDSDEYHTVE